MTDIETKKAHLLALLFAVVGGAGFLLTYPADGALVCGLLAPLLTAALYFVWLACLPHLKKRGICCAAPAALLLGFFFSCGVTIDAVDALTFTAPALLRLVASALGSGMAFFPFLLLFSVPADGAKGPADPRGCLGRFLSGGVPFSLLCWLLFFLSFLPALLAYWPGIFAYDLTAQITQMESGDLTAHHPLLHTLLAWLLLNIGKHGNDCSTGALCYSLFQMLCLSGAFAYAMNFLARRRASPILRIASLIYFLLPFHGLLAINATKDVLHAAAFLPFFLFTADMVLEPRRFFSHPLLWLRYAAALLLMALIRKTGIYVAIIFFIFAVAAFRRYRRQMLALSLSCLVLFGGVSFALERSFSVAPGSTVEALSLPLQQVARSWRDRRERFTDEQTRLLLELISEEQLEVYSSRLSDPIKNPLAWSEDEEVAWDEEEIRKFLPLWLEIFPHCPGSYLNAALCISCGYWYPDMQYPDVRSFHEYIETSIKPMGENYKIERSVKSEALLSFYAGIAAGKSFRGIPGVSLLFTPGIYVWLLTFAWVASVFRRKYRLLLPLGLLAIFWCTLLLSPIALLRYAYPMMICLPAALALPGLTLRDDSAFLHGHK